MFGPGKGPCGTTWSLLCILEASASLSHPASMKPTSSHGSFLTGALKADNHDSPEITVVQWKAQVLGKLRLEHLTASMPCSVSSYGAYTNLVGRAGLCCAICPSAPMTNSVALW